MTLLHHIIILLIAFLLTYIAVWTGVHAQTLTAQVRYNNDNISGYQPPVATFEEINGEFYGTLTDGTPFSQTNVVNDITRLQKFTLQDAYWYISDKGEIWADNDLQALSIYLTK